MLPVGKSPKCFRSLQNNNARLRINNAKFFFIRLGLPTVLVKDTDKKVFNEYIAAIKFTKYYKIH